MSAQIHRGTRLITVTAENENPWIAQNIASAIVDQYIQGDRDYHMNVAMSANNFLSQQADILKQKLEESEQALQAYKEQHQAVSLENTQNITVEKLKDLNDKLTAAKGERLKFEADYAEVQKLAGQPPEAFLNISSVADAPSVLDAKKDYMAQQAVLANLSQRYLPKHPMYIQAMGALKETKDALDRTIMSAADSVETQYHAAQATEAMLGDALKEQEQSALALNKIAIPYDVLQHQVDSDSQFVQLDGGAPGRDRRDQEPERGQYPPHGAAAAAGEPDQAAPHAHHGRVPDGRAVPGRVDLLCAKHAGQLIQDRGPGRAATRAARRGRRAEGKGRQLVRERVRDRERAARGDRGVLPHAAHLALAAGPRE